MTLPLSGLRPLIVGSVAAGRRREPLIVGLAVARQEFASPLRAPDSLLASRRDVSYRGDAPGPRSSGGRAWVPHLSPNGEFVEVVSHREFGARWRKLWVIHDLSMSCP